MSFLTGVTTLVDGVISYVAPTTGFRPPDDRATAPPGPRYPSRRRLSTRSEIDFEREGEPTGNSATTALQDAIARQLTEAPLVVTERPDPNKDDRAVVAGHPALDALHNIESEYTLAGLLGATVADLLFHGEALWLKQGSLPDAITNVEAVNWLPRSRSERASDEMGRTLGWRYHPGLPQQPRDYGRSQVIRIVGWWDFDNPYQARSPLRAASIDIASDNETRISYLQNQRSALGDGVIIRPDKDGVVIDDDDAEELVDWITDSTGGDRKGEPLVSNQAVKIERADFSPREKRIDQMSILQETRMAASAGIPAPTVGLGGANQLNYAVLYELTRFGYETRILSLQRIIAEAITEQLLWPHFPRARERDQRFEFDVGDVRVLRENENDKAMRVQADAQVGIITQQEARLERGYQPQPDDDDPGVYLTQGVDVDGEPSVDAPRQRTQSRLRARRVRAQTREELRDALRRAAERAGDAMLDAVSDAVGDVQAGALASAEAAVAANTAPDAAAMAQGADDTLAAVTRPAAEAIADDTAGVVSRHGPLGSVEATPAIVERVGDGAAQRAVMYRDARIAQWGDIVQTGLRRDYSIPQIMDGVPGDGYRGLRATLGSEAYKGQTEAIAYTESAAAQAETATAMYREAGVEYVIIGDGVDSDAPCAAADGQRWTLDEYEANQLEHPRCVRTAWPDL